MSAVLPKPPDYLHDAYGSVWYVPGHDREEAWAIDDPDVLDIELTYMRAVPPPPPGERGDQEELHVGRDERGRFKRVWWWEVCSEKHPDAQPFLAVRYPPSWESEALAGPDTPGDSQPEETT